MSEFPPFKKTILVTGAGGQLGMELWKLSDQYSSFNFLFATRQDLPIDDFTTVKNFFEQQQIHYCINCAAYTAVDKAESEKEAAFLINGDAVENLASVCNAHQAKLFHISTDYVFDGTATSPSKEEDKVSPVSVYGASKLRGEELALNKNPSSIIIRTSWVYSSFGKNFVKTMLRLLSKKDSINVVNDQFGSPTYAADLAEVILKIIAQEDCSNISGIFNYCNEGIISWYDFAAEIKKFTKSNCIINAIPTSQFPTPAKRPSYSVLDTSKIKETFGITIPNWRESLQKCLMLLQS